MTISCFFPWLLHDQKTTSLQNSMSRSSQLFLKKFLSHFVVPLLHFFFFFFFFGVHRVHPMYLDALLLWRLFIKLYYCVSKRKSFCKNGFFLNLNCWFVHLCHFGLAKIKCSTSFKVGFIFCIECRGYALFSGK